MPSFRDRAISRADPEDVWKLLYDPARFPEWWAGTETVEMGDGGAYTMFPEGYPDFPMAQQLETSREDGRVTVSCLVSDLRFEWRLRAADGGTEIAVAVEIPDAEAARLDTQRDVIRRSLAALAARAAGEAADRGPEHDTPPASQPS